MNCYRLSARIVTRYETQLGMGVVFHPGLKKARRVDLFTYEVLQLLATEAQSISTLARLIGARERWVKQLVEQLETEGFIESDKNWGHP